MSKNIEEIVGDALPEQFNGIATWLNSEENHAYRQGFNECLRQSKILLKQALTEGKLVVPLSLEEIGEILKSNVGMSCDSALAGIAIYKAQFGGNK